MSRDVALYLEDIQTSCQKILRYIKEKRLYDFQSNDLLAVNCCPKNKINLNDWSLSFQ